VRRSSLPRRPSGSRGGARTLSDETTSVQALAGLDQVCVKLDARIRRSDGQKRIVAQLAGGEPLHPAPASRRCP
jgi:hypothetical protein